MLSLTEIILVTFYYTVESLINKVLEYNHKKVAA